MLTIFDKFQPCIRYETSKYNNKSKKKQNGTSRKNNEIIIQYNKMSGNDSWKNADHRIL